MSKLDKLKRKMGLFVINHLFSGTHFFAIKKTLLIFSGIPVGRGSKVVGPLYIGGAASLSIGEHVWLGRNAAIEGNGSVSIGSNVNIGPCVSFGTGGHEIGGSQNRAGKGVVSEIVVGSGTWIGQNVVIVNSSTIGSGVVVAAGAVVIGSTPDDVLIAGVPATIKRELPRKTSEK